jgi:hypothetical protein
VVNEPASAINVGLVMVPREHSRAQEKAIPFSMEGFLWSRLQALIREAQGPFDPTDERNVPTKQWSPQGFEHKMPIHQWQRLAQDMVFDRSPLYRIRAQVPSDYMVVWNFLCTIMGHLGFEKVLKDGVLQWGRNGSTRLLQEQLQRLHPRFSGWAGPQLAGLPQRPSSTQFVHSCFH